MYDTLVEAKRMKKSAQKYAMLLICYKPKYVVSTATVSPRRKAKTGNKGLLSEWLITKGVIQ